MGLEPANPVVHLQLRTPNPGRACAFYTHLFGWSAENLRIGRQSYLALDLGLEIDGGVVEDGSKPPAWIPYVEVCDVGETVALARSLGATVVLPRSEGAAGWRSVLEVPDAAEIAFWQPKT